MACPPDPESAPEERSTIDVARNIQEWEDEVRDRVARMVTWSLRTDRPVAEPYLRKLGPDGRAAFGRALNRALDRKLRKAADADEPAAAADPPERIDPSGPVLLPEVDWADRRRLRSGPDTRTRCWAGLIAILLVSMVAVWLRQQV